MKNQFFCLFKGKKNNRKGFSIIEMMISLAVVIIVSVTAISIILSSNDVFISAECEDDAVREVRNALETFKYADDLNEFKNLYTAFNVDVNGNFTIEYGNYSVKCRIYDNIFTAHGVNVNGKEFISFTYKKADDGGEST